MILVVRGDDGEEYFIYVCRYESCRASALGEVLKVQQHPAMPAQALARSPLGWVTRNLQGESRVYCSTDHALLDTGREPFDLKRPTGLQIARDFPTPITRK